jgi:hypothetical protein
MSNNQTANESIPPIIIENTNFNFDISIGNDTVNISLKPVDKEIPFYYNYESTLEDLGKTNKIFAVFNNLEEVKKFLYFFVSKKENIKINEENDEKIIIQINYLLGPINKSLEITFEKKITDDKKMITYLTKLLNVYKMNSNILQYDSKLITNISQIELIKTGIKKYDNSKKIKLSLLFRASRDGDTIKAFHDRVDGISPTISLIETKTNYIFGGFTDHAWDSKSGCVNTNNTFMFSFNKKKIYIGKNGGQIHCANDCGPWFCNGAGVYKDNYFKENNSYEWELKTNMCFFDGFTEEFELVGGVKNFMVNEVEVFKVEYI